MYLGKVSSWPIYHRSCQIWHVKQGFGNVICSYARPLIRVIYTVATRKYRHRYSYLLSVCQSARTMDHYAHRLRSVY